MVLYGTEDRVYQVLICRLIDLKVLKLSGFLRDKWQEENTEYNTHILTMCQDADLALKNT